MKRAPRSPRCARHCGPDALVPSIVFTLLDVLRSTAMGNLQRSRRKFMKYNVALVFAAAMLPFTPAAAQQAPAPAPAAERAAGPRSARPRQARKSSSAASGRPTRSPLLVVFPTQLFFHENGADFDVILFKPVTGIEPTPAQEAAMDKKRKELSLPEAGPISSTFANGRRT
ncbi:hypothetical protein OUZ56_027553 [Daphnia magna]|uniref:Uncharacterized protein n=1 Tax=Daphnia magna TaxID=35525 RepID=A0ABQ9ZQI1_9CRUS|nr:hypothetical protein OUZ56_027553 [Daphnia magna]